MLDNKWPLINHFTHSNDDKLGAIGARHILESDPPEVSYLLIISTLAEGSSGTKSDLRPTP